MSSRRPGLGKGLDALISTSQLTEPDSTASIMQIAASQIRSNPHQPRKSFNEEELEDLAASIREHGIIQPLVVTKGKAENEYILIAGERRLEAAKKANLEKVPAILREVTDQEMLLLALIENVQRSDLNPIETAIAYQNLSDNFSLTHEQIGQLVGKKRATVSNTLSLLNTSSKVQDAVRDRKFTEGHANAIQTLPIQTQNAILDAHLEEYNFNVRQIETLSRYLREFPLEKQLSELKHALKKKLYLPQQEKEEVESPPQAEAKPAPAKAGITPEMEAVRSRLADHLSTKVTMRQDGEGGAVTFHFYSTEELNRILDLIFSQE